MKSMVYLLVLQVIKHDTEWAKIYQRLVPKKCSYDERRRKYIGKRKVIGRIAGQMISLTYVLLKTDQELLTSLRPGETPSPPMLYDPVIHKSHREGGYPARQKPQPAQIVELLKN